jgi:hypothetical protein
MTNILSLSDTASLSSDMIRCTTVVTFNMLLLDKLEACTDRTVFWISCCGRCYCTGGPKAFPTCLLHLWFLVLCPEVVQLDKNCSDEVNLEKNILQWDPSGAHYALLLCSSPIARLQPQHDTGWGFSPSPRVQLQQFGVDSVSLFSGRSLCRWPPLHHKHLKGCLQSAQTWPKFWQM